MQTTEHSSAAEVLRIARLGGKQFPLPARSSAGLEISDLDSQIRAHPYCVGLNDSQLRAKFLGAKYPFGPGDPSKEEFKEYNKFLIEIFPLIHEKFCVRHQGLEKIDLTRDDIAYLLANPIGAIIRRPFLAAHFVASAKEMVTANEQNSEAQELVLDSLRKFGFSKFLDGDLAIELGDRYPSRSVWVGYKELKKRFAEISEASKDSLFGYVSALHDFAMEYRSINCAKIDEFYLQIERLTRDGDLGDFILYADPPHVFNVYETISVFLGEIDDSVEKELSVKSLVEPLTFMIVEDNKFYAESLKAYLFCKGASACSPDGATDSREKSGIFTSAERALEVLDEMLEKGTLPDVILSDIELGDQKMNGINFVKVAQERCRAAGKNIRIVFISSSNMSFYAGEIAQLQASGLVAGSFRKADFTLPGFIDAVNSIIAPYAPEALA
jgi:CheY-like chemotaxis protein